MTEVIKNMDPREYHSHPAIAHSKLKYLPGDPELFYGRWIAEKRPPWAAPTKPSPAMRLGTVFHGMLLEGLSPDVPPRDLRVASNGAMTTTEAKAWVAEHPDYLKRDEYDNLAYALERCYKDPEIAAYLNTDGDAELSLFWQDAATGLECRGRLDRLCRFADGLHILDVKFGMAVDQRSVEKQLVNMLYYRQAGYYWEGVERCIGTPVAFTFLFVHNAAPYDALLYQMNPNDIDLGRRHNNAALSELKDRMVNNRWFREGYGRTNPMFLPKWVWEADAAKQPIQAYAEFQTFNQFGDYQ